MVAVTVARVATTIDDSPISREISLERLRLHRSILEQFGVTDLGTLGTLDLSGSVIARPGMTLAPALQAGPVRPRPDRVPSRIGPGTQPLSVLRSRTDDPSILEVGFIEAAPEDLFEAPGVPAGGGLHALRAPALRLKLDVAYFVGQTVTLAAGTVVALARPHLFLTFIAEELRIGPNVTFTYEHPLPTASPVSWVGGDRPPKPAQAPTPASLEGVAGSPGAAGEHGGAGFDGVDAPEIELWALRMSGSPIFDLRGQDGWPGGRGRDGGEGGDGSDGRAERYDFLGFCAAGAGAGGDGGRGGDGGTGGIGGAGGHGGRLRFYAPRSVLETYAAGGFRITTDGGSGGQPGGPGAPGDGGAGGRLGSRPKNCQMFPERHDGVAGPQGSQGGTGALRPAGGSHADAVAFLPITEADFREELTKPALVSANPSRAEAGATITLSALRLQPTDTLLLDEEPVPMSVVADTLASFVLPAVVGGSRVLRVRQADGGLSNRLSFYVLPHLAAVGDGGRARPGTTLSVNGTGFAPGARVRVNGEDMPDAVFASGATMTFTLRRPGATEDNPSGEVGHCSVILADGTPSNTVDFVIDTILILVIGDSVAWGQGLRPHEKFPSLVAAEMAAAQGGIKSYLSDFSHSGATIGVGDTTTMAPINGEVPTSYPTAMQQVDLFTDDPAAVDLVLVTAGLNDVNFRSVISPLARPKTFAGPITQSCHVDAKALINTLVDRFPNAMVLVTGYFPIVSDQSDVGLLQALLVAAGVVVAGLPGGDLTGSMVAQIVTNCRAFHDLSTLALRSAVEDVNDRLPAPRAIFVDAGFQPENAALAPQAWLYGINADLSPQDDFIAGDRGAACVLNADRTDVETCKRASLGHPNPAGSAAYAAAIMRAVRAGPSETDATLPAFPPGFLFGVATAAMQNEGNISNNDWFAFSTSPAIRARVATITAQGGGPAAQLAPPGDAVQHGDLAVLGADLDLAAGLGVNAFRFSVEWARLMPSRPSHGDPLTAADIDPAALAYYDGVLDQLDARSMTPVLSLNHLSLPLWVLDPPRNGAFSPASFGGIEVASADDPAFQGSMRGWENTETVAEYLRLVSFLAERWRDRITWWVTLNEPVGSMIGAGYFAGVWPPGFTGDATRGKEAYFNLIRAHVRAYEAIKAVAPAAMVGLAHAMLWAKTTTELADTFIGDQDAARNQFDYFYNWHMLEAIIDGRLDTEIHRRPNNRNYLEGAGFAAFAGIDPATPWRSHCDYIGLNYYRSVYVFADALVSVAIPYSGGRFANDLSSGDQVHQLLNPLGWEICPEGFGSLIRALHDRHGLPVLITENGIPQDVDRSRGAYVVAHLTEILTAVTAGADVRGYMYWTLVDNWEWQEGYRPAAHFGLLTVDRTLSPMPRRLTEGAETYASVITTGEVRGARERFGIISVGGNQLRPPRGSAAFFAGTLEGNSIELILRATSDAEITGLLWEAGAARVLRLAGQFDRGTATLHLQHPPGPGLAAGAIAAQRSAGSQIGLAGIAVRNGVDLPWSATQDLLVGQWAGSTGLIRFQLIRTPGGLDGYIGSYLEGELPGGWEPLSVTINPTDILLEAGGRRAVVSLVNGSLAGSLTSDSGTVPWTAARLPDIMT